MAKAEPVSAAPLRRGRPWRRRARHPAPGPQGRGPPRATGQLSGATAQPRLSSAAAHIEANISPRRPEGLRERPHRQDRDRQRAGGRAESASSELAAGVQAEFAGEFSQQRLHRRRSKREGREPGHEQRQRDLPQGRVGAGRPFGDSPSGANDQEHRDGAPRPRALAWRRSAAATGRTPRGVRGRTPHRIREVERGADRAVVFDHPGAEPVGGPWSLQQVAVDRPGLHVALDPPARLARRHVDRMLGREDQQCPPRCDFGSR